jgi:predicted Zn-dependent protease
MNKWIPAATLLLAASAACALNPATGKREFSLMSEAQEIAIGQQSDGEIRREMGIFEDRELQEYVARIGASLAKQSERPHLPWHFSVVDQPVINAFALPGGYIYLSRGILPFLDNEAQLAGVLGHEIGHVTARHSAQQYSRVTGAQLGLVLGSILVPAARPFGQLAEASLSVLFLKYGREDEIEADNLGVRYAARTGWDPAGVAGMLTTLDRIEDETDRKGMPNWLATHPAPEDRVQRVQAAIREAGAETSVRTPAAREDYMRRIDGLIYGDNPEQGIVRGRRFLHSALRFALDFPEGWTVVNQPTQVVARHPQANAFVLLQLVQKPLGSDIQRVALTSMQQAGFQAIDGSRTTVNGLAAFIGTYQGTMQDLGRVGVRAAHIVHGRNVYLVAGLAPAQIFTEVESELTPAVRSFRALTAAQAAEIQPNRIDLYTARQGDTWQSIAERAGSDIIKPSTLAIMNGRVVAEQPRPGERLKIVVGG